MTTQSNQAVFAAVRKASRTLAAIPAGKIDDMLRRLADSVVAETDFLLAENAKDLARMEGIMCGISSGTNVAAALKLAEKLGEGKTVVTVLPDTAERYFSTPLFDND